MLTLPSPQPLEGTALAVLEEVTSGESRQDVATKLVKIFLGQGLAVPLLDYLTTRELARTGKCQGHPKKPQGRVPPDPHGERVRPPRGRQERCHMSLGLGTLGTAGTSRCAHLALPADPNTLFRSNSLASKSMEQFMKVSTGRDTSRMSRVPSMIWGQGQCLPTPCRWWGCPTCTRS